MKKIKILSILIIIMMFAIMFKPTQVEGSTQLEVLVRGTQTVYHYNTSNPVMIPTLYQEKTREMRATWVPTVFNLAGLGSASNEAQFKTNFQKLIADVKDKNMNAILFQVRGHNDAWYDSEFAPWSVNASGAQGVSPGWDVMAWMVDYTHSQGLEFHAWLNPYRVANSSLSKEAMLSTLHSTNFARQNPHLVVAGNLSSDLYPYILNPGEPEVKTYIRNVVVELMELYDVDGIHFDDYFYPYSGISSDTATYDLYKLPGQTIADFRRESINDVVRGVKEDVDAFNLDNDTDIRFGISPFGIWESGGALGSNTSPGALQSNKAQYADSRRWVKEGWLHYINPQVYWNFTHSLAPYADVVDWWAETVRGTGVDLVIGHSTANASGWLSDEISAQIRYNSKHPEIKGSVFYSSSSINSTNVQNVKLNNWTTMPISVWETSDVPSPNVQISGDFDGVKYSDNVNVTMTSDFPIYYRLLDTDWTLYTEPLWFTTEGEHVIYVKAVDGEEESMTSIYTFTIDKINMDRPTITLTGDMRGSDYVQGTVVTITSEGEPIWVAINHGSIGEYQLYEGPIVLESTGNYLIRAKTINSDNVSSQETQVALRIVLPCYTLPVIDIQGSMSNMIYSQATMTLSGASPIIEYRVNGGTWTVYQEPVVFDESGSYQVQYRNQDGCRTVSSTSFEVSQETPNDPTIIITGEKEGNFYIEEVKVEFDVDHEADTVYYRIHNGRTWSNWIAYLNPIMLVSNANYTIEYYAENAGGNRSETLSELIRIDMPPTETNRFVIRNGAPVNYYQTDIPVELPTTYTEKTEEVRAVWVATVAQIDVGLHTSEATYKQELLSILNTVESHNMNTIFFQVRPMNDAFYPSDYAPFSRYLTGTEGVDPGWDVLAFFIEEAHKRGIEVHAWLNPYRVSFANSDKAAYLDSLHDDNFAKQNPSYVMSDNNGALILNPGIPAVREYIYHVVNELMENYDIDGIHFDDYFYSYSGMQNSEDAATYQLYKEADQSLADWRRENVNILVRDIFNQVETYNQTSNAKVKFGISPFGIWQSGGDYGSNTSTSTLQSYHGQYADTKKWVEEGWLHYILPQLYWQFDHALAPYADLVDWWANLTQDSGVDLIIGHGFYRFADNSWTDPNELTEQLRYMSTYDAVIGSAFFSYKTLNSTHPNVVQTIERLNTYYWTTYATFPWASDVEKEEPLVCEDGYELIDDECVLVPITCEPGYENIDGECVLIPVVPPVCGTNEELIDGTCVPIESNDEGMSQGLIIGLVVGGSTLALGGGFFLVKKFLLKV